MLALSGLWILPAGALAQGPGPRSVEVALVEVRTVAPTIQLVGTVHPRLRTIVASEVSGLVTELTVDDGERVKKGRTLCRLRDFTRKSLHEEAVAIQQRLTALHEQRLVELKKAEFQKDRTARLHEVDGFSTEMEFFNTSADVEIATGGVKQAAQDVEAQKAIVARLADELDRTRIRAPCDGSVVRRLTQIGSWIDQGGAVVEMIDLSTVRIRVGVPEEYIRYCPPGTEVMVKVEAVGKEYVGRIARVIPEAQKRSRSFPVDIDIRNEIRELKAGMFARALVPSGPAVERQIVPKDAVVPRGPSQVVFVVRAGEPHPMAMPAPVKIVSELEDKFAVESPSLKAGDQVIVRGNEFMFGPGPVLVTPGPSPAPSDPKVGEEIAADTAAQTATER
ncbi:MAG: efflux RND transporter periplasmic adaptor subunit [Planctomycetota bacterium]|nr:efflux RND transporter periplasmic adaptor subunit [Planctomycetota bacterium]